MSGHARLLAMLSSARRRALLIVMARWLPWLLPALALGFRFGAGAWAWLAVPMLALGVAGWRARQRVDLHWLARLLDRQRPELEDSSSLLLLAEPGLSAAPVLVKLQRARLEQRLAGGPTLDLREALPARALAVNFLAALPVAAACWFVLLPGATPARSLPPPATAVAATQALRLTAQAIRVQPPAYTGLATREETTLAFTVPEASVVEWKLRFSRTPDQVALRFHDGTTLPLQLRDGHWTGQRTFTRSTLYRVQAISDAPVASAPLHRIKVIADRPPQIRVLAPERSLSLLDAGQTRWSLDFEGQDDHGLGAAQLCITLAQGSGENISVSTRTLALSGTGPARTRKYRRTLDLAALGFAQGDDLVVRLQLSDNRRPSPQVSRSSSFILRWPPDTGAEATGVEGLVKRTLPAYFRSQRQIIIDSEALIAERRKLAAAGYLKRSEEIGIDQRILRMRYGQFLGEEADAGRSPPPPGGAAASDGEQGHDEHAGEAAGSDGPQATGDATSVVQAFGHTHDESEAATLLDPDTRKLLKSALDEMWQSELHLRQGRPDLALPFEYRALRFIKQVQQASRIYLARVGLELPAIDETRRLGGDRTGLQSRRDALRASTRAASPPLQLWQALEAPSATPAIPELAEFETWLRDNEASLPEALDIHDTLDAWRSRPDCAACLRRLRGSLWPLLPTVAPQLPARSAADAGGRAYLDAIHAEPRP